MTRKGAANAEEEFSLQISDANEVIWADYKTVETLRKRLRSKSQVTNELKSFIKKN